MIIHDVIIHALLVSPRELVRLIELQGDERLERPRYGPRVEHLFDHPSGWIWDHPYLGARLPWITSRGSGPFRHVFVFSDGTLGTCDWNRFDRALAVLGASIESSRHHDTSPAGGCPVIV